MAKKSSRGRKKSKQSDRPSLTTEDTEALLNYGNEDSPSNKPHPPANKPHPLKLTMVPTLSIMSMDVDYGTLPATLKSGSTIFEESADSAPAPVKRGGSSKRGRGGRKQTTRKKSTVKLEESLDLELPTSPKTDQSVPDDQSDATSELSSKVSSTASQSGRGRKGRGKAKPVSKSKPKKEGLSFTISIRRCAVIPTLFTYLEKKDRWNVLIGMLICTHVHMSYLLCIIMIIL